MSREVIGGRFELRELLGRGGMSEVWLAEDLDLGRSVALKLLAGDADPDRLRREARAIAALSHPHIAGVYDVGQTDGRPYIVLEYLPGGSLEDRLREGAPLRDHEVERLAREIAAGLAHAHANGIVHRDLKPSNILFDAEGRARIADFGIARAVDQVTLTEVGTVMGTAAYLSPEAAEGRPTGPPADVYAFGVIVYRLLTGRLPFTGDTALEVALKHQRERPPAIQSIRAGAPAGLATLAEQALAKAPEARPPDGAALGALLAGPATVALSRRAPDSDRTLVLGRPPPPVQERRRKGRLAALALVLVALAGGGALAAVLLTGDDGNPTRTQPRQTGERQDTTPPEETPAEETTTESITEPTTEPTTSEQTTTQPETTTETTPTTVTTSTDATTTGP